MKRIVILPALGLLMVVIAVSVHAHGTGWGRMGGAYARGGHHMMNSRYDGSGYGNISEEERNRLDAPDRRYYEQTEAFRYRLRTKEAELDGLLAVRNPDLEKPKAIQRELSEVRAQFDEKQTEYEIEARKIIPNRTRDDYGRHMGGYGPMMGSGSMPCW